MVLSATNFSCVVTHNIIECSPKAIQNVDDAIYWTKKLSFGMSLKEAMLKFDDKEFFLGSSIYLQLY